MNIVKILGSLYIALFLISALTLILIFSTSLESVHGTPFAQRFFYQAGWFDLLLSLLAVNILCAALSRFPLKKRHTGFVITHIGLLTLLSGSLLSRLLGVDGQIMLYEGQKGDQMTYDTYEIVMHSQKGHLSAFDLASHPGKKGRRLKTFKDGSELYINQIWEDAVEKDNLQEGKDTDPFNRAVVLELTSQRVGAEERVRLIERDPSNSESSRVSMGPAEIALETAPPSPAQEAVSNSTSPTLHIVDKGSGKAVAIDLKSVTSQQEIPIAESGLKVKNLQYYPDARVGENNQLVNASEEARNPAVEFDIEDGKGQYAHYIRFALFPEFESFHGKNAQHPFNVTVNLAAPSLKSDQGSQGPSLTLYHNQGLWTYESKSSQGILEGSLTTGESYPTGWMDFSFTVKALMDHAVILRDVEHASGMEKGRIGAEVSLVKSRQVVAKDWVLEERPSIFEIEHEKVMLIVRHKTVPLPFTLLLKDFRKVDYPGTAQAASYESDVALHDLKENLTLEKTISMNRPLDYKGYRIFQSSFVQDPREGEASIFTVAKNPGITPIYAGSCIMFLGIFITFFIPPLSSVKYERESK